MDDDSVATLEEQQSELAGRIEAVRQASASRKDIWDILAATTPLVTGLLISGIGMYFAYTNNQAQLKLQETQTIEKFIPHLIGSEPEKKAAIIALSSISSTETAAKYAELFPSEGTASALKSIATSSNTKDSDKKVATKALAKTFHKMADDYQATKNAPKAEETYQKALAVQEKLVGKDSPELIDDLDRLAEAYTSDKKYSLAETSLKKILKIQRKSKSTRSKEFIDTLNKLAQLFRLDGKTDAANHLSDYANLLARQLEAGVPATSNVALPTILSDSQSQQNKVNPLLPVPTDTVPKAEITELSDKTITSDKTVTGETSANQNSSTASVNTTDNTQKPVDNSHKTATSTTAQNM